MGTTAQKLTYLNDTKGLLKDSINNLGGSITSSTTFRQYATELDSIYSKLPKISGKGTAINLTPTLKSRINSELYGDTSQNGTPTPSSPVPIECVTGLQNVEICGKNFLDTLNWELGYIDSSGVLHEGGTINALFNYYIKVKSNTIYTISANTTVRNIAVSEFDNNKTFIKRTQSSNNASALTITTDINTKYVKIHFNYDNATTITQAIINNIELQLELGNIRTTYEPYKGNTYEVNLGKNLLDKQYFENGSINTSGADASSNVNARGSNYINVLPNTTYTISTNTNVYDLRLNEYDNTKTNVIRKSNSNSKSLTITTGANTYYVRWSLNYNNSTTTTQEIIDSLNLQLEVGSQATPYSPYFTPIELNKIGTYEDRIYKDSGKWYLEKNIGKVVLDGTQTINNWNNDRCVIYDVPSNYLKVDNSTLPYILCTHYKIMTRSESQTIDNAITLYSSSDNVNGIIIHDSTHNNSTSLTNFFSSNNSTLYYVLATPTTTEITNTELIEDLENLYKAIGYDNQTNISSNGSLPVVISASMIKGAV